MPEPLLPPDDADEPDYDESDDSLEAAGMGDETDDGDAPPAVFVSTRDPVALSVAPLDDERAPEGSALGAYIGDRLVARCAMPREAIDRLMEMDLFSEPVPLALLAVEEEPGLQCRLFALIPAERLTDEDGETEPWQQSVPSFEEALAAADDEDDEEEDEDDEEGDEEDDGTVASILLGHIVRFQKDRKFADDLTAEAVDVLQKIVLGGGPLQDADSKAVDDLLDSL